MRFVIEIPDELFRPQGQQASPPGTTAPEPQATSMRGGVDGPPKMQRNRSHWTALSASRAASYSAGEAHRDE